MNRTNNQKQSTAAQIAGLLGVPEHPQNLGVQKRGRKERQTVHINKSTPDLKSYLLMTLHSKLQVPKESKKAISDSRVPKYKCTLS